VARLLNRHDITNIQYSLRKLESTGLIEKKLDRNGKTYSYKTTETGFKLTDEYYKHKEEVLIKRLDEISGISDKFHNAIKFLSLLTGIYDEAAQDSTKYFPPP
jgi:predicted MarR family transcription regulator